MLSEQMLPAKCSPKNAPPQNASQNKMLSIKMVPEKNAPPKKCSLEKMLSSPPLVNGFETNSTYLNLTSLNLIDALDLKLVKELKLVPLWLPLEVCLRQNTQILQIFKTISTYLNLA